MELIDVDLELEPLGRRATKVSGSIGQRLFTATVQRFGRLRSASFEGNFDVSPLVGQVKRDSIIGTYGPERIALESQREGTVAAVTGRIGDDRIKSEFVSRSTGPMIVRLVGKPQYVSGVGLELSSTLLYGSVERLSDALSTALIAPMVLDSDGEPGGPTLWI